MVKFDNNNCLNYCLHAANGIDGSGCISNLSSIYAQPVAGNAKFYISLDHSVGLKLKYSYSHLTKASEKKAL